VGIKETAGQIGQNCLFKVWVRGGRSVKNP